VNGFWALPALMPIGAATLNRITKSSSDARLDLYERSR
jgi:hypothetical protein